VAAGLLGLSRLEFILLLLTITGVMAGELLNTAVELILNLLEGREHPVVRLAKDVAAGGVLMAILGAVVVGLFLFGPRLMAFIHNPQSSIRNLPFY
jgi:diacylglycerol kinase